LPGWYMLMGKRRRRANRHAMAAVNA